VYERDVVARRKTDGSPVTEADQRAEVAIIDVLKHTGIPIPAAESVAAGRIPDLGQRFFCVDPLDGTREFLKRNGEFAVNIALCEGGRATLGVVYAPVTGELWWGGRAGAFKRIGGQEHPLRSALRDPLRVV